MVYKNKLIIAVLVFFVLTIGSVSFLLTSKKSSDDSLVIGVYHLNDPTKKYDELMNDIEARLGIRTKFIELIPNPDGGEPERVKYLSELLRQSKVDIILGAPNSYTQQLIDEGFFMDITDHIEEIEHIQKSVIDVALKVGKGRIYTISPIISEWYCLFENVNLLNELGIKPIDRYISWDEFLRRLENIQKQIEVRNEKIKPLAMVVQNEGEKRVFIEDTFLMYGFGLDAPLVENDILLANDKWAHFFLIFSDIIKKFGSNYADVDQRYLFNTYFSMGNYVTTLGSFYQLELYTGDNLKLNEKLPTKVYVDFDVNIVPLPVYPGDEGMLNVRLSSMAINKASRQKEKAIQVLNYMLSKEFTIKMIEHRYDYNNLGFGVPFLPAYYDDEIIEKLNVMYHQSFDVNWIYKATKGSVTYPVYDLKKRDIVYQILNKAFSDVYNNKITGNEALKSAQIPIP